MSKVHILGVGSIIFEAKNGEHQVLHGVYYIPALQNSIMSLGQLDEAGSKVEIEDGVLRIWVRRKVLLVKVCRGTKRLYVLHINTAKPLCLAARKDDAAWPWQERYSHVHFDAVRRLSKGGMVRGLLAISHIGQFCDTCVITKHCRTPFPCMATYREDPLKLAQGDFCGQVTPASPGGRHYILLLVDDATRYMWIALFKSKDAATDAIKHLQATAEKKSGKVWMLRNDNGLEFTVADFAS